MQLSGKNCSIGLECDIKVETRKGKASGWLDGIHETKTFKPGMLSSGHTHTQFILYSLSEFCTWAPKTMNLSAAGWSLLVVCHIATVDHPCDPLVPSSTVDPLLLSFSAFQSTSSSCFTLQSPPKNKSKLPSHLRVTCWVNSMRRVLRNIQRSFALTAPRLHAVPKSLKSREACCSTWKPRWHHVQISVSKTIVVLWWHC